MKIKLIDAFLLRYPKTAQKICAYFEEATGQEADFANLTKPNLARFVDYLQDHLAGTSCKTYCAQMKAVMNIYSEDFSFQKGWEKILSVKNDTSEQIYLTDDELRRVIEYCPDTRTEAVVHQQFILSALVGARHGDIVRLNTTNIRDGYICYVSQKTHLKATVPMSETARKILTGEFFNKPLRLFAESDYEKFAYRDTVSDTTFNDVLRRICRLCDIDEPITLYRRGKTVTERKWKFASSHLGRRTAATLLYLHGCDIYSISRILAHSSVEMTAKRYICAPLRNLSEETMAFFSQFK